MKTLKIEMAGLVDYNDMNCRNRTAFTNDKGQAFYFEYGTGHTYIGKHDKVWFHISHLFRIDIEEDNDKCYTRELNDYLTNINNQRLPYTRQTLLKVLSDLGLTGHELVFLDYYTDRAYRPLTNDRMTYNMGN